MRCEVLTEVITLFWNVTPCRLVEADCRFGGTCSSHIYGRRVRRNKQPFGDMSKVAKSEYYSLFWLIYFTFFPYDLYYTVLVLILLCFLFLYFSLSLTFVCLVVIFRFICISLPYFILSISFS